MKQEGKAIVALVIFGTIFIISLIAYIAVDGMTTNLWVVVGVIIGMLGTIVSFCIYGVSKDEKGRKRKSVEFAKLAKKYGVSISEFCFNIGDPQYDGFCIDTVHGLFAGVYEMNTIQETKVAPVSYILTCSLEEETQTVSNAKTRAIVGGLLGGTVGAVAGAVSAKEREQSTGNYILTITTNLPDFGTRYYRVNRDLGLQVVQYLNR